VKLHPSSYFWGPLLLNILPNGLFEHLLVFFSSLPLFSFKLISLIEDLFSFSSYFLARFWKDFISFFTHFIAWSFLLIWPLLSFGEVMHPELFSFLRISTLKSCSCSGTYVFFTHSQVECRKFSSELFLHFSFSSLWYHQFFSWFLQSSSKFSFLLVSKEQYDLPKVGHHDRY